MAESAPDCSANDTEGRTIAEKSKTVTKSIHLWCVLVKTFPRYAVSEFSGKAKTIFLRVVN